MDPHEATKVLRQLERQRVAPPGERPLEVEAAASQGAAGPTPVLLLTDKALYALRAQWGWVRLPLSRMRRVTITTDSTGILTRYEVVNTLGDVWLNLAVSMARPAFRVALREVAAMALVHTPTPEKMPRRMHVVTAAAERQVA